MSGIAGYDNVRLAERAFLSVEMNAQHAVLFVGTMTREAIGGKDGANLTIEIDARRGLRERSNNRKERDGDEEA